MENKALTYAEAEEILMQFNAWRLSATSNMDMPHPTSITKALGMAIKALRNLKKGEL